MPDLDSNNRDEESEERVFAAERIEKRRIRKVDIICELQHFVTL